MKKHLFCFFFLLALAGLHANACTTFFINRNGKMVFGRNYDWVTGSGMITTNLRGLAKTSFPMQEGKTISWVSKYGSISFNQYGKEFPTGGMNERGLVVELMWLDDTKYPAPDERPAISVLQWIQYQLDNCATVEEIIQTDKLLRIASLGTTPLHYLVADKLGNAATIEFLDGKMKVHKGSTLTIPVLANDTYQQSLDVLNSILPKDGSSASRFSRACSMVKQYDSGLSKSSAVDYAFTILEEVSQGDFTKWSIVYDVSESKIYFKTNSNPATKFLAFSAFRFSCADQSMSFDLHTKGEGDISSRFTPFSDETHLRVISKSFQDSRSRIGVPTRYIQKINEYQGEIHCK